MDIIYRKINHDRFDVIAEGNLIGSIVRSPKTENYMLHIRFAISFLVSSDVLKHIVEQIEFLNAKPKDNDT